MNCNIEILWWTDCISLKTLVFKLLKPLLDKTVKKKAFKSVLDKGQIFVTNIFSFTHDTFYFLQRQFQHFYKYLIDRLQMLTI